MGKIIGFNVSFFMLLLLFLSFLCFYPLFLHAASSITQNESIKDGSTLVSEGLKFEMGFFGLNNSSRYVGIWYRNVSVSAYVWVANRENPIKNRQGSITIKKDGNLVVLDGENNEVWSSNISVPINNSQAVLRNDGNLILSDRETNKEIWQTFEDPTDTYLPGMKVPASSGGGIGKDPTFRAWKSEKDPSFGKYTMSVDSEASPQIVIMKGEKRRWRSGYWDGRVFSGVPNMTGNYLYGFRLNTDDKGERYFVYEALNSSDKIRFQIAYDGFERQFRWNENEKKWNVIQSLPYKKCEFYNSCGSFAICDESDSVLCKCLKGFEPKDMISWKNGNWSKGCKRKNPLKGERTSTNSSVGEDGFLVQRGLKLPDFAHLVNAGNSDDCERNCLQNSSCTAYVNTIGIGCMVWFGELVDVQRLEIYGNTLNIRLSDSDLDDAKKKTKIWITLAVVMAVIFLGIFAWLLWRFKGKLKVSSTSSLNRNIGNGTVSEPSKSTNLLVPAEFSGSVDPNSEGSPLNNAELSFFNFSSIVIATNNFSEENKLGQGGFGPVYKGKLPGGEEIAVKRLCRKSSQGSDEFKNEMMLIAKLQHRNLVRLLGCSVLEEEKLLVYEYMPNKSLDFFLFDPVKQTKLDWTIRSEIIEGIARGLLYLHRDSRLRIIHRDLKASNILLDENMNPKISDFGLARIFGGNQNEDNTTRVVGTYGYMSPEYAMEGLFSVKSDVYSFGVLLLEIVSGRKNTSFRDSYDPSLIGYAWRLWNEERVMELVDPSIRDSCKKSKALRCIHIGMLCVQDSASNRPNMSSVVLMLESEATTLPLPIQPLFTSMRRYDDTEEFHTEPFESSVDLTVTGR
ncbi:G-type lectin S-receptor-like serine/threonine-protein kinase B120 [Vicia villosa]|uniref:G-type lectin S-receptor-like serine/threonine-protein kinase B120 n=1 Tax=Vicia villosa TaxID=3911 RepID=UPI00273CA03C|nr:G-type lectin S-receptor-like serine/threonine-protein kinase B120 [Vicia villosa]